MLGGQGWILHMLSKGYGGGRACGAMTLRKCEAFLRLLPRRYEALVGASDVVQRTGLLAVREDIEAPPPGNGLAACVDAIRDQLHVNPFEQKHDRIRCAPCATTFGTLA